MPNTSLAAHDEPSLEVRLAEAEDELAAQLARNRELEAALERRTALLHEVDHRIKNNLQVISSLALLKARRMKDKGAQRVLHDIAERIGALSIAHRLLAASEDASRFDLGAFASDLSADLMSSADADRIALALDVEPIQVSAAQAAPLALMLNELIGNALRHAFPDGRPGRIGVAVRRESGFVHIVVEDDGVGVPDASAPEESFGRTMIDLLVRQLRATLDWQDQKPGTRVAIVIPLEPDEGEG